MKPGSAVVPKILSARLHFTTGPHAENGNRPWTTRDLVTEGTHLTGDAPPDDATAWYVDDRLHLQAPGERMVEVGAGITG